METRRSASKWIHSFFHREWKFHSIVHTKLIVDFQRSSNNNERINDRTQPHTRTHAHSLSYSAVFLCDVLLLLLLPLLPLLLLLLLLCLLLLRCIAEVCYLYDLCRAYVMFIRLFRQNEPNDNNNDEKLNMCRHNDNNMNGNGNDERRKEMKWNEMKRSRKIDEVVGVQWKFESK